jgi:hypothetical protein
LEAVSNLAVLDLSLLGVPVERAFPHAETFGGDRVFEPAINETQVALLGLREFGVASHRGGEELLQQFEESA